MTQPLAGVVPPIVTPIDADREVDTASLTRHVEHLLDAGVHGIFALGSSGEVSFLSDAQRATVITTTVATVGGRVPVIAGAIDTSSARVADQVKRVADAGADYAVVTAPFYAPTQQADIEAHFRAVAQSSPLPLIAYDIPVGVKTKLAATTLMRLAVDGVIVAVKDSSGQPGDLRRLVMANRAAGSPLTILTGTEVVVDADFLIGVDGVVPGLSNVDPAAYVQLFDLLRSGNWAQAHSLQDRLATLFTIIDADQSLVGPAQAIGAFKEALRLTGRISTSLPCRPLTPLSEEAKSIVRSIVDKHFRTAA